MLSLLFVDDDAFVLSAYRRMLHKSDYHCQFLQWPEQLWQLPDLAAVDMAFIDQQMPAINGSELLLQLQQRLPLIKRVLVTGDTDSALKQLSDELVLHALLAKPCSKTTLTQCINKLGQGPPNLS